MSPQEAGTACLVCGSSSAQSSRSAPLLASSPKNIHDFNEELFRMEAMQNLSHLDGDIEILELHVRQLEAALAKAKLHQTLLAVARSRRISSLARVNRFPDELLSMIFVASISPSCGDMPLVLARVCSRWRTVALSTPQLWSTLYVRHGKIPLLLQVMGTRSGRVPVTLDIVLNRMEEEPANLISNKIVEFADRWEYVTLTLEADIYLERLEFAQLEQLTYLEINVPSNTGSHCSIKPLVNAPRLREVVLRGISLASISLPWNRLESLCFQDLHLHRTEILDVLPLCPTLRTLRVEWALGFPGQLESGIHVLHDNLRVLEVPGRRLLSCLTLTNLQDLKLGNMALSKDLLPFLRRSQCALQSFNIPGTQEAVLVLDCLMHLHTLTSLVLRYPAHSLISALIVDAVNPSLQLPMLPNLEDVTFTYCGRESEEAIVSMVSSRLATGSQSLSQPSSAAFLRRVRVTVKYDSDVGNYPTYDGILSLADTWKSRGLVELLVTEAPCEPWLVPQIHEYSSAPDTEDDVATFTISAFFEDRVTNVGLVRTLTRIWDLNLLSKAGDSSAVGFTPVM